MWKESQVRFWVFTFVVFAVLLWILKPVLLPFIIGIVIAYFLAPVVDRLASRNVPRWMSTATVLLTFCCAAGLILSLIIPLLQSQVGALLNSAPSYIEKFRAYYIPDIENWLTRFSPEDVEKLRDAANQSVGDAAGLAGNLIKKIVSGSFAVFDIITLMIITPVVAFYILRDWPHLTRSIDGLLPRRYYDVIYTQLNEIDTTLSGFIRGQALVCLILGFFYSVGLTVVGLQYGAAIGIIAGVLTFIPYVGTSFGWITSLILAIGQFNNDWTHISLVMGVFVCGHILESYVLTPRLVGKRVGLHPIWVLFALITGAKLMGFVGVLVAVPVAAVLGVLIRFGLRQYKASPVYKDTL